MLVISSNRYTFKLIGGSSTKIRKGEIYEFKGLYGFNISCQEQQASSGGKVHTHVWIKNEEHPEWVVDLYLYVAWDFERYPKNTTMFALVHGWALSEDETEFEGPDILYELIIDRKLSNTHINHLFVWLGDVLSDFLLWRGMDGLFGEGDE